MQPPMFMAGPMYPQVQFYEQGGPKGWGGYGYDQQPLWHSQESYLAAEMRPEDADAYAAMGILIYRTAGESGGVEVLLALERPWNSLVQEYDPIAWNILGGKRRGGPGGEWEPAQTAVRCFLDGLWGTEGLPTGRNLHRMCQQCPVAWYPRGKYGLLCVHLGADAPRGLQEGLNALPENFKVAKAKGALGGAPPADEGKGQSPYVDASGAPTTKYVKQIDELEWVPAADLLASDPRRPLTDLLSNFTLVTELRGLLHTGELPSEVEADVQALRKFVAGKASAAAAAKGKGEKGGPKGGKAGKAGKAGRDGKAADGRDSKGRGAKSEGKGASGEKGKAAKAGGRGEGKKARGRGPEWRVVGAHQAAEEEAPPPPPPSGGAGGGVGRKGGKSGKGGDGGRKGKGDKGKGDFVQQQMWAPPPPPCTMEMQKQMLGEQLYMLVQPMVPSHSVAQKVTGMLLDLPMPELMPLLGPLAGERTALGERVAEALQVLEVEGRADD